MKIFNMNRRYYESAGDDGGAGGGGSAGAGDGNSGDGGAGDGAGSAGDGGSGDSGGAGDEPSWRDQLITTAGYEGDDATKISNLLERVTDPKGLLDNYSTMSSKIRNGEISTGLPENATPEQIQAYRENNGVPLEVDGYTLPSDLTDADKAVYGAMAEAAHAGNVSDEVFQAQLAGVRAAEQKLVEHRQQQDSIDSQQADQLLRGEWKGDYEANMNRVEALLQRLPAEARDAFKSGRMADDRGFMNTPEVLQFLVGIERELNPAGAVIPNSQDAVRDMNSRVNEIEQMIKENPRTLQDNAALDKEYTELLEAQEVLAERNRNVS